jgi:outer membrane protein assembly factor BamB
MSARMKATTKLATVLIVMVMGGSVALTGSRERDSRFVEDEAWSVEYGGVESLQVIDLDGDGTNDVFMQNRAGYEVHDAAGVVSWVADLPGGLSTTMGDVDGDGDEEIVAFRGTGVVQVTSGGAELWSATVAEIGPPSRSAVLRFGSGTQVIVGDMQGQLVALRGSDGAELWRATIGDGSEVRGLDDALIDGDRLLIAADRSGRIVALTDAGELVWDADIDGLRRMRTFDADGDGRSEVYSGGEAGVLFAHRVDGQRAWFLPVGQQVVEVREGELNGDPTSRELVVGGRFGGVFAVTAGGQRIWAENVGDRVSDIVIVDLDDDGVDETVVGEEGGGLTVFRGATGERFFLPGRAGGVLALDEGSVTASDQVAIAGGSGVSISRIRLQEAPFFYTPILAGLVLSLAIAGTALFIGSLPERTPTKVVVNDSSPAGLLARRRMLFEGISDVEELMAKGEIEGPAALGKLEGLRAQLAETTKSLREAGVAAPVETMKCPNCGGRVRLGTDRCDYCGEVVIA